MSPEAQNKAIAEACGRCAHVKIEEWTISDGNDEDWGFSCVKCGKDPFGPDKIPNYFGDLNAVHEAEKVLLTSAARIAEWEQWIRSITQRDGREGSGLYERIIRATAPQRCEALLKALGLWQASTKEGA